MSYTDQDKFFARAYRTGTDHWTNIPFKRRAHELTLYLPKDSFILDLGTGRGKLLFDLADLGFRAIGLENNEELIERGNSEIKARGLDASLRFFQGTALNIPLADQSFDALVDVGLLQHILPADYPTYVSEATRVLKQGGYFYLVVLSKKTPHHFSWHPSKSEKADFELEGVNYHFFSDDEIRMLFEKNFEIKHIDYDMPHGPQEAHYAIVLLKKK